VAQAGGGEASGPRLQALAPGGGVGGLALHKATAAPNYAPGGQPCHRLSAPAGRAPAGGRRTGWAANLCGKGRRGLIQGDARQGAVHHDAQATLQLPADLAEHYAVGRVVQH